MNNSDGVAGDEAPGAILRAMGNAGYTDVNGHNYHRAKKTRIG